MELVILILHPSICPYLPYKRYDCSSIIEHIWMFITLSLGMKFMKKLGEEE
jgi:hypothetical protein